MMTMMIKKTIRVKIKKVAMSCIHMVEALTKMISQEIIMADILTEDKLTRMKIARILKQDRQKKTQCIPEKQKVDTLHAPLDLMAIWMIWAMVVLVLSNAMATTRHVSVDDIIPVTKKTVMMMKKIAMSGVIQEV